MDDAGPVKAAQASFDSSWSRLSPTARGRHMIKLAEALAGAADELAEIETRENGKLLKEMSAQARVVPEHFYYCAADGGQGRGAGRSRCTAQNALNYAVREPLGVVADHALELAADARGQSGPAPPPGTRSCSSPRRWRRRAC